MLRFPWKFLAICVVLALVFFRLKPQIMMMVMGGGAAPPWAAGGPPELPVSMATVIEKSITQWHEYSGRFEARDAAEIRPRASGAITKIWFEDGQMVKSGQPLFTIDTSLYEAEAQRASGSIAAAEASLVQARQDFSRAQKLWGVKAISRKEFDAKKAALQAAEGNVKAASGALKAAKANLGYATVTAPISGKISRAEITVGNVVNAGPNAPLLASIVAISPIYAGFEMDEKSFLSLIHPVKPEAYADIPVEVSVGDEMLPAKIHAFDNQLDSASGTMRVRVIYDNADGRAVPGLFAKVRIGSPEVKHAILINQKAVGTEMDKKFVTVILPDGKPEFRPVVLGQREGDLVVVESGLSAGEKIVVNGLQRVRPGITIKPEEVDMITLKGAEPVAEAGKSVLENKPAEAK